MGQSQVETDSQTLINYAGRMDARGNVVADSSALQELHTLLRTRKITVVFEKVAAHTGLHGNEEADRLAKLGASLSRM